jgi:hypothetical protein
VKDKRAYVVVSFPFGTDPIATYTFKYRSLGKFMGNIILNVARNSPLTVPR